MADSDPNKSYPKGLLWLKLPDWAEDVPENVIHHMLEETAQRCNLDLKPYDPNTKGKGRKIILHKKEDLAKKQCKACLKVDEHFTFQCPNDPDKELFEATNINGVEVYKHCSFCDLNDDHYDWECPHIGSTAFGPGKEDFVCSVCCVMGEHYGNYCPKLKRPNPEPGFRECRVCKREDDRERWTEYCRVRRRMFCWICDMVGEHSTEDCPNARPETEEFCSCCESKGHSDENCPRETNDGREYCSFCDLTGDHHCQLWLA